MGSSLSKIRDDEEAEQWDKDKLWLEEQAEAIKKINPSSIDFRHMRWFLSNKDKIIGNRQLINLLR